MSDEHTTDEFTGTARLFPLPNLVLFPNVVQPIHIFEPRYRQLAADALVGDKLIAIVLLQPGWEDLYNGRPAIHSVACLCKIIADQRLADGRYNLLLRGLSRIRLKREIDSDKLYREAIAELLEDEPPVDDTVTKKLRQGLSEAVVPRIDAESSARNQVTELFEGPLSLGAICDVLGFALPFAPEGRQVLLEELTVARRVARLIEQIKGLSTPGPLTLAGSRKFPPDFSRN